MIQGHIGKRSPVKHEDNLGTECKVKLETLSFLDPVNRPAAIVVVEITIY